MAKRARQKTAAEPPKSRIPVFKSIEEEAEFWDTHSTTEFEDEFEEVTDVKFIPGGPTKAITVRLDLGTLADLEDVARANGVPTSRLARLWIFERVRDEKRRSARKGRPRYGRGLGT